MNKEQLRKEILEKVAQYYELEHKPKEFTAGTSRVPYGGRVFDEKEMINLVDSSLDFWLTSGRYCDEFEVKLAKYLGVKYCSLTNSGSSANLLAFSALTSAKLGDKRVKPGDEVITVAAGFPTTVTPIIQNRAIPVFVDIEIGTYNIDVSKLEQARSDKTKAVMVAHTLGNTFDLGVVKAFCDKYNLWLIEDNCDALGSKYNGQFTGTFGHIATQSFYPPHHMTMGEGGAVLTNDPKLRDIINSFRDWGRDCWCPSGKDDSCNKRFGWQLGELPAGYDHKYTYSHLGYNLKVTEMQAAIGVAQLDKLDGFTAARKDNFKTLYEGLKKHEDKFILPRATAGADPSWFGFLLTVKENAGFTRDEIVNHLEKNKIQTRMLFAGNLIRHPAFDEMRATRTGYRVAGDLTNTDRVMRDTFWIGVYPGMTKEMLQYMIAKISEFVSTK